MDQESSLCKINMIPIKIASIREIWSEPSAVHALPAPGFPSLKLRISLSSRTYPVRTEKGIEPEINEISVRIKIFIDVPKYKCGSNRHKKCSVLHF